MFTFFLMNFKLSSSLRSEFTKENVSPYIFSDVEKFQFLGSQVLYITGGAQIMLLPFHSKTPVSWLLFSVPAA